MLIIGSYALMIHGMLPEGRLPADIDFIVTLTEWNKLTQDMKQEIKYAYPISGTNFIAKSTTGIMLEMEVSETGNALLKLCKEHPDLTDGDLCASPGVCLALKLSHRYKKDSPHFLKTMRDIQWLRSQGVTVPEVLKDWLKDREAATYSYKHPKLNQGKSQFFDTPGITYQYDHDDIHKAVAVCREPMYRRYMKDGAEVQCDKDKFFALPNSLRMIGVLEEAYVLALERCLIPFNFTTDPKKAFDTALMKVCTSITSGWFREFAWENYDMIQFIYSGRYVDKFHTALAEGNIKQFTGDIYAKKAV
jgi:hypothetical protein